jgi:hypothetical protein
MPQIWVLVLLCNCVQPAQTLFATRDKCEAQGKRELAALDTDAVIYRCLEVPRG